jgi:predicted secreted protein
MRILSVSVEEIEVVASESADAGRWREFISGETTIEYEDDSGRCLWRGDARSMPANLRRAISAWRRDIPEK